MMMMTTTGYMSIIKEGGLGINEAVLLLLPCIITLYDTPMFICLAGYYYNTYLTL